MNKVTIRIKLVSQYHYMSSYDISIMKNTQPIELFRDAITPMKNIIMNNIRAILGPYRNQVK